jgi:hypothetical protein
VVGGALESQDFISTWNTIDKAMVIDTNGTNSLAMPATDEPSVLVFEFFHSRNTRRRDAFALPGKGKISTNFRITSVFFFPIPLSFSISGRLKHGFHF